MRFLHKIRKEKKEKTTSKDNIVAWAGALAHEIRNPLNTIRINLQLVLEDLDKQNNFDKEKNIKRLKTLDKEVIRLETTLNDFLRFVRLPEPNLQRHNLFTLLNELLDFAEPESQQANVEIIRDFSTDLPDVEIDSNQIKQALLNIIINANQSMPSGGRVTVKAQKTNNHVNIDIADTGIGIPSDSIDKVFNLFYSTKEDGTGLGLPIAKRIVEMHNGEIKVKSKEGEGTTFSIILPIHV